MDVKVVRLGGRTGHVYLRVIVMIAGRISLFRWKCIWFHNVGLGGNWRRAMERRLVETVDTHCNLQSLKPPTPPCILRPIPSNLNL